MTSPRRPVGLASSIVAGASLALPGAAGAAWFLWGRTPPQIWTTRTVRGFALLLGIALVSIALIAFGRRRLREGLAAIAVLLLGSGGLAALQFHFHGRLSLGEGEVGGEYTETARGPAGRPPRARIEFARVEGGDGLRLTIGGRVSTVRPGQWVGGLGWVVQLVEAHAAPAFTLAREDGRVEDQLLVKLNFREPPSHFFHMALLPYRFYVGAAAAESDPMGSSRPGRIAVRVLRGKLTVARGTIAPGEALEFEGYRLTWGKGAEWAVLDVWSVPPWLTLPVFAGTVMLVLCAFSRKRMRRPPRDEGKTPADESAESVS